MFEKLTMLMVKSWTKLTTPERKGFLKRVHVTRSVDNKIKKTIIYYPRDGLPEYEVIS